VKSRKPIEIDGNMLRAIFTKPAPSDTRGFFTRLLTSIQPIVKFTRKGISYIGIRGGVDF
jgi:hypothetical protein